MLSNGFAVAAGALIKGGGVAALRIEKAVFCVVERLHGTIALPHQIILVGVSHVVHDGCTVVDGINYNLRRVGVISLIESLNVVATRNVLCHIIFVVTAPGDGIPVQVFAEHESYIIAERYVVDIVHGLIHYIVKFLLRLGRESAYINFRHQVWIVIWILAPKVVSICIPVAIQTAVIQITRHPVVYCVSHLPEQPSDRYDFIIACQNHVFQRSCGPAPGQKRVMDKAPQLGGIISSGIGVENVLYGENAGRNVLSRFPLRILIKPRHFVL